MQQLIFEEGGIGKMEEQFLSRGISSAFIITGRHFAENRENEPILSSASSLKKYFFVKNGMDVDTAEVNSAFDEFLKSKCMGIAAIGGGSVMDLAKGIIFRFRNVKDHQLFFIAIPTTAGSGSEATSIAVVYENKVKKSLQDSNLLPGLAILDPVVTYSLSPQQTAISGMDTLSQAIESLWAVKATTASKEFARESLKIATGNLAVAVNDPTPIARKNMMWSSHLAGQAINITRTTGPHALSYRLTAHYKIPHGQAVALFLPIFFVYNETGNTGSNEEKLRDLQMKQLYQLLGVETGNEAMHFVHRLMTEIGIAKSFAELGLQRNNILDGLLKEVNMERFQNNPRQFDREKLEMLCNRYL